MHNKA